LQALLIFIARFISGLALGTGSVITPIYCEEIAEVSIRGALGILFDIQVSNGILFAYVVGAYVSYLWLCITSAIIPVIFFVTFIWMPESPIYLVSKGKVKEAEKSLLWLRGARYITHYDVKPELERIQKYVLGTTKESPSHETASRDVLSHVMLILKNIPKYIFTSSSSPTSKAIKIVACLMIFRQLSGINAVIFYTVDIFKEAGSTLSPSVATVIVGVSQVFTTYVSSLLVERTGRRMLLLFSVSTMAVSHMLLVIYFYLKQINVSVKSFGWLPLLCVTTFVNVFSLGFGPLPWVMMAELVPNESKSWASGLAVSVNWILVFAVTNLFGIMVKDLGPTITFAIFCGMCTVGTVVVAFIVPETKGKTREEIKLELRKS
jgi:SP family facilitated glucose transporter-like MFS transporter 8